MTNYMPAELRDQLAAAQRKVRRTRSTRSVHAGGEILAILEMSDKAFAIDAEKAPALRGLVDIYDGKRHLYQALIVAAAREGDVVRYRFKRNTGAIRVTPEFGYETES